MRIILSIIAICYSVAVFGQGQPPSSLQGNPDRNGVLIAKKAYWDRNKQDTLYQYVHSILPADSLYINGQWHYSGDTVTISTDGTDLDTIVGNEYGNVLISNDSLFYRPMPDSAYVFKGKLNRPDSLYAEYPFGPTGIIYLRDGEGSVEFDPSPFNEMQNIEGYETTVGSSSISPHNQKRINISTIPKSGFFIPPDYFFNNDDSNYNELGESFVRNDSLLYMRCQECDEYLVSIIDTSNTNEYGNITISSDSIFYQACPTCPSEFKFVLPEAPTPDGSETIVTEGTGIDVTGSGTVGDPYVVTSTVQDSTTVTDGTTIDFTMTGNDVTAEVIDSSITPEKLDRAYASPDTIYILATGQSNAGDRGLSSPTGLSNLQGWNGSTWSTAAPAVSHIGFEFAKNIALKNPDKLVRYVRVWLGSTKIEKWYKDSTQYNLIVSNSNAANVPLYDFMLWMQGEENNTDTEAQYGVKFDTVVANLKLNPWFKNETEIIVKGLSYDYLNQGNENFLRSLNEQNKLNARYVSTLDLGDGIHVNGAEIDEVARRMFNSIDKTELIKSNWLRNPITNQLTLRYTSDNVGIGVATPTKKLMVSGLFDLRTASGNNLFITGGNSTLSGSENIGIGNLSVVSLTSGSYNLAVGAFALQNTTTATNNVAIGFQSQANSNAQFNIGVGYQSLLSGGTGYNIGLGYEVGDNISGNNNVAFGQQACQNCVSQNIAIGQYSTVFSTGSNNVGVGKATNAYAGSSNTTIGFEAYSSASNSGSGNVMVGNQVGLSEAGSNKLYIDNSSTTDPLLKGDFSADSLRINGKLSVKDLTATPAKIAMFSAGNQFSTATIGSGLSIVSGALTSTGLKGAGVATRVAWWAGTDSLSSNSNLYWDNVNSRLGIKNGIPAMELDIVGRAKINQGTFNLLLGAGNTTLTGTRNIGLGNASLFGCTTCDRNLAIGETSLYNNSTGYQNAVVGNEALFTHTSPTLTTAIGFQSMKNTTSGIGVTSIGWQSGISYNGNYSTLIGYNAGGSASGNNTVAIGVNAGALSTGFGVFLGSSAGSGETGSNKLYIDNSSTATPLIHGNFAADSIRINGTFSVRDLNTTATSIAGLTEGNMLTRSTLGGGVSIVSGALSIDHGGIGGLGDDDHPQYHNDARGDARYYTETELNAGQLNTLYYTETEMDAALALKQNNITLTTTGTSGAATLIGAILNIPNYSSSISGLGTANYVTKWTSGTALGNTGMYEASSGVFGINTTSPGSYLATDKGIAINGTFPAVGFNNASGYWVNYINGGDYRVFNSVVGTDVFTIKNSGNVGIGTTSPSTKLHVNGDLTVATLTATPLYVGAYSSGNVASRGTLGTGLSWVGTVLTPADASTTNEIQTISKSGNALSLSLSGGSVNIANDTPADGEVLTWSSGNWIASAAASGANIYNSDGTIPSSTFREVMISAGADLYFTDPSAALNFQLNDHLFAAQINDGSGNYSTHVMTTSYNRLGFDTDNYINFNETGGTISLNGSTGTSGYVLKSGGAGTMTWGAESDASDSNELITSFTTSSNTVTIIEAGVSRGITAPNLYTINGSLAGVTRTVGIGSSGVLSFVGTGSTNIGDAGFWSSISGNGIGVLATDASIYNTTSNTELSINSTGAKFEINGSFGTSGYVLKSGGSGSSMYWDAASGGISGSGTAGYLSRWSAGTSLGSSGMYETSAGSGIFGIGTTSPGSYLATDKGLAINATFPAVGYNNPSGYWATYANGGDFRYYNSVFATDVMTLKNTGRVGIGTTSPSATMHVIGNMVVSTTTATPSTIAMFSSSNELTELGVGTGLNVSGGNLNVSATQVNTYTSSATWTKPSGCASVTVKVIGGGGGGGSGGYSNGSATSGGGGGGAGGYSEATFPCSGISSTVTVTIGAGGDPGGGINGFGSMSSGNAGVSGGTSSFGSYIKAAGGGGGAGGSVSGASGGTGGAGTGRDAGAGGTSSASLTSGGTAPQPPFSSSGGNGGAGTNGTSTGSNNSSSVTPLLSTSGSVTGFGTGGTGGGSTTASGGNGNSYGGGGGGGAAKVSTTSGDGGFGADGIIIVITHF